MVEDEVGSQGKSLISERIAMDTESNSRDELDSPNSTESESDSESQSEDEAALLEEVGKLEAELVANPFNYDAHVQKIKLLRKAYEVEKLKKARETMSSMLPLTSDMWMEWARDEAAQSSFSGTEPLSSVEKIYERGISEYLSVPLWSEYLKYVEQHDHSVVECSPVGTSKIRNLYERAVTAAGSHVADGNRIWEAYRTFEMKLLSTIDDADVKGRESQMQRIRSIFHRNLSIPLLDLKSTLLAYKAWEADHHNSVVSGADDLEGVEPHVVTAYQKAKNMLNERMEHEERISNPKISDSEKFQNFMEYLNFEKSAGDPARVQLLYERAIAVFPVSTDIWLDYTCYMDRTLKVGSVLRDVYFRAAKNCSWVGEIWVRYLLFLERSQSSPEQISEVFGKSMQCSFSTLHEYLDLFLTRIDGLRRMIRYDKDGDKLVDFSTIRDTFQYASDYLSPQMNNTDGLLNLHAYWARLEHNVAKDLAAARGVWESLLKISGSMLEAWLGYIRMEIELGNIREARAIYKRCFSKRFPGAGSEEICRSWIRFEREFGSLEDFDHAVSKATPRLKELQMYQKQQVQKLVADSAERGKNTSTCNSREKRKIGSIKGDDPSPAKRQKFAASGKGKTVEKVDDHAQMEEINEVKDKALTAENIGDGNQKESISGKQKPYSDQCTAFLSNLNLQAKYEDLEKFFSEVGGVVSIRILRDKFTGKQRGLAYVDFSDEEHLNSALAKNKQLLMGKKVSIIRSDPNQRKRDNSAKAGEGSKRSDPRRAASSSSRSESIELKGSVTFAVPRNVRSRGKSSSDVVDDAPKSNEEFRKLFIKK